MIFGEASVCTSFACSPHVAALGQWGLTVQASVCLHVVRMCCGGLSVFCGGLCVVWWSLSVLWWSLCCVVVSQCFVVVSVLCGGLTASPCHSRDPRDPRFPLPETLEAPRDPRGRPTRACALGARSEGAPSRSERRAEPPSDRGPATGPEPGSDAGAGEPDPNLEPGPARTRKGGAGQPRLGYFCRPPTPLYLSLPVPPPTPRDTPQSEKNKSCSRCTVFRLVSSFRGTSGGREGARDRLGLVGREGVGGEGSQDGGGAWRGVAEGRGGGRSADPARWGGGCKGAGPKMDLGPGPRGRSGRRRGPGPLPGGEGRAGAPGRPSGGKSVPARAPRPAPSPRGRAGLGRARRTRRREAPAPRGVRDGGAQNRAGGRRGGVCSGGLRV
nr:hypothetical protein [Suid alphaherpesvirus 1]